MRRIGDPWDLGLNRSAKVLGPYSASRIRSQLLPAPSLRDRPKGGRKMRTSLRAASLALTALILTVPATAEAADRICRGAIGAVRVDDVRVPEGATCTLAGT